MNGLQNMYGQAFAGMDGQSPMDGFGQDDGMEGLNTGQMDSSMMGGHQSQTLDQIVSANNQEMLRRRQTMQPQYQHSSPSEPSRRASMLEFSSGNNGDLADFQFDPNPQQNNNMSNNTANSQKNVDPHRVRSREDLGLDTRFAQMPNFDRSNMGYSPSMMANQGVSMDPSQSFLGQNMDVQTDLDGMSSKMTPMQMSSTSVHTPLYATSPTRPNFPAHLQSSNHDPGGGSISPQGNQMMRMGPSSSSSSSTPQRFMGKSQQQIRRNPMMPSPLSMSQHGSATNTMPSPAHAQQQQPRSRRASMDVQSPYVQSQANGISFTPDGYAQITGTDGGYTQMSGTDMNVDTSPLPPQPLSSKYANAYSTTGFDMLGVLMRVATRRNPDINIGPVDLSCAFVVCDIAKHDLPIVYCSDMFERLTGYSRHEILGRNCRFLQAPDGKVQSGIKRKYVDDKSVLYLKNQINRRAEAQLSLINYRKGGQPFMNLLTMIPITWDNEEFRFFVGFQVDLVEQPNSVSAKNPDGTYEINYNRSALPAYRLPAPDQNNALENMGGQTIPRDEVSQVLATIGNGETDLSRRIWDKVLLENTDDVVHVLSLKGLFLYLSPSCKGILEYDSGELVGTALSSVCHPSDIVPVTRELKDSSTGAPVNVVYRIRRKNSGYTWFEAHGCLHTEQGKGRKCIILVGRTRPVYALDKTEITPNEGAGDAELWSKISTTGMFLYVSSASRSMLDRLPDDLVGSSMQNLMRQDSRKEFGRVLELARMGEKTTFKHDMQNRRGQVLQAQTTIYPGDAKKGFKPTFLLAQTRLLKLTRAMMLNQKTNPTATPRSDASVGSGTPMSTTNNNNINNSNPRPATLTQTMSSTTAQAFIGESGILTQAGSGGVPIGSQDEALAAEDNIFDELKTTRSTSWQFELRQMERQNRLLAEDLQTLLSRKKKRKRRKGMANLEKDCANCHTRVTPEWRRGPSGQRDLCNSCGLRWAKQNGRVSPRKNSGQSDKSSTSPAHISSNPNSKEPSAETGGASGSASVPPPMQPSDDMNGDNTPIGQHGLQQPLSLSIEPKIEDEDLTAGSMPPVIEEGQEPPHPNVLPA